MSLSDLRRQILKNRLREVNEANKSLIEQLISAYDRDEGYEPDHDGSNHAKKADDDRGSDHRDARKSGH